MCLTPLEACKIHSGRRCGQVFVSLAQVRKAPRTRHEALVNIDVELFFIARKESVFDPFDAVPPKSRC